MILSRRGIRDQMAMGKIKIDPFNPDQLNPNSYNLRLHPEYKRYDPRLVNLDSTKENPTLDGLIPESGILLKPGLIYLCRTVEYTETLQDIVPMIEGRSSFGRLGVLIHVTAGFGDIGYKGVWTLELACIQPVRIYPYQEICQIFYHQADAPDKGYDGRYQGAKHAEGCKLHQDPS